MAVPPGRATDYGMILEGETGEEAEQVSQGLEQMKRSDRASEVRTATAQQAGDKLFYLQEDVWVDSVWPEKAAEESKTLAVKYDSEAYWSLLSQFPELGPYLALGEKVQVVFQGVRVTVGETGAATLTEGDLKLFQE